MKVRGLSWPFLLLLWMLCSSRKAGWISLSRFLGSWGSDFPTQSNKNSFVLDLNHSSPLIFRSAFAVWCNRGKTYWLLQSKAGCFESPGSKIQCFWTSTTCSLPKTPPNPMHHERWYDHLWHEKWGELPEATQIILNCPHGMILSLGAFQECCHASKTWSLSLSCSGMLAEDCAKGKSALTVKPAQSALFQNTMENVLLCSTFLLSVKV